ncbi:putative site-specific tyrosine recombinase XerC [Leptospira interrogans str. 2003000735]|uniref:tyrosine-type recombinase/integrase n=1 Tax=Leptospira interrogans TaxID=173 RepID=UPI00029232DA|nr:tyrosine-type recombinase/integrase [Leptospira interrogans]EKN87845.1 putative site-specific tyrosine recombinase XerC [Leptospira interrogans str. 2002000624]EKQ37660.1 putative site-specific tyrosine recombinase XerC [Leptospira interrogans str. 2002000621]EKQ46368.1 putative site-specific tyrosine recombinase XerC [Leptospira interrogans str. 2002000623]EMJ67210.1 putative site-specific tyrosine recombinase XerC [Leptospira interrogans str. 2003000735]
MAFNRYASTGGKEKKIASELRYHQPLTNETSPSVLETRILEYLDKQKSLGISIHTIRCQRFYLEVYFKWCMERGIEDPNQMTMSLVDRYGKYVSQYRNQVTKKVITPETQNNLLINMKTFYEWMQRREYIGKNPCWDMRLVKTPKRIPRNILKVEEVEKILSVPDLESGLGVRNRAILELFYSTGIRLFELQKLKISDVDLVNRTVFILEGKRRQDRLIPISERASDWIRKYLEEVRITLVKEPDDGILFVSVRGGKMDKSRISEVVKAAKEKAGVEKKGSTHMFRHTTATLMLDNGADIRHVQEMLGHQDLNSTQIYTHVAIRKLQEVYENTHPSAEREENISKNKNVDMQSSDTS